MKNPITINQHIIKNRVEYFSLYYNNQFDERLTRLEILSHLFLTIGGGYEIQEGEDGLFLAETCFDTKITLNEEIDEWNYELISEKCFNNRVQEVYVKPYDNYNLIYNKFCNILKEFKLVDFSQVNDKSVPLVVKFKKYSTNFKGHYYPIKYINSIELSQIVSFSEFFDSISSEKYSESIIKIHLSDDDYNRKSIEKLKNINELRLCKEYSKVKYYYQFNKDYQLAIQELFDALFSDKYDSLEKFLEVEFEITKP